MKKIIFLVLLLLVVVALAPLADGVFVKREFLAQLNATAKQYNIILTVDDYHLGWLNSQATFHMQLPDEKNSGMKSPSFTFTSDITHGPVLFNTEQRGTTIALALIDSTFLYPKEILPFLVKKTAQDNMLVISSLYNIDGSANIYTNFSSIQTQPINDVTISWAGAQGVYDTQFDNNTMTAIKGHTEFGALVINSSNPNVPSFELKPTRMQYDTRMNNIGLWNGETSISSPGYTLSQDNQPMFAVESFNLQVKTDTNPQQQFSSHYALHANKLNVPNSPVPNIAPISISMDVNNLNAKAIVNLSTEMHRIQNTATSTNTPISTNQVLAVLKKVISPSTTIIMQSSMNTPLGALQVNNNISQLNLQAEPTDYNGAIKTAKIQADIKIAAPLATRLADFYLTVIAPPTPADEPLVDPSTSTSTPPTPFDEQIAKMMKSGKLSLTASIQIMTMEAKNVTAADFADRISKLNLPPATAKIVNDLYATRQISPQPALPVMPTPSAAVQTPDDLINQLVNQGFLIREQDNFTVKITNDNGSVQINGKPLQQGVAFMKASSSDVIAASTLSGTVPDLRSLAQLSMQAS